MLIHFAWYRGSSSHGAFAFYVQQQFSERDLTTGVIGRAYGCRQIRRGFMCEILQPSVEEYTNDMPQAEEGPNLQ